MTVRLYFAGSGASREYGQASLLANSGDQAFIEDGTIEVYEFGACILQADGEYIVPYQDGAWPSVSLK